MPTAVVTGTSSGFGRAVAERLAGMGWRVIGTVRDPARATPPAGCEMVVLDLADEASIEAAGRELGERCDSVDALVSNAGIAVLGPIEQISAAQLRRQIDVNLTGTILFLRACLPLVRAARGVLVQVSSVSGRSSDSGFGAYSASKFGLGAVGDALALELAPHGVRVVTVEPSAFRTEIGSNAALADERDDNLYPEVWAEIDEFVEYVRDESPPPGPVIDAIVAAATTPGAPVRLPVTPYAEELRATEIEAVNRAYDEAVRFLRPDA